MNKFQQLGKVKHINDSILNPSSGGLRLILSLSNLAGEMKCPLYPLFDKKWRKVKENARGWFVTKNGDYKLGAINTTAVQSDVWVIHMLCQDEKVNTNIVGLEKCLKQVSDMAKVEKATVNVSNMLLNLIPELYNLLDKYMVQNGVSIYLYEEKK